MRKVIPVNTMPDGTCRTIKSQYFKNNAVNFLHDGTWGATCVADYEEPTITKSKERLFLPKTNKCLILGYVWKSSQNGAVYDPRGIAPTICAGCHSGVEPKIIVYEEDYPT